MDEAFGRAAVNVGLCRFQCCLSCLMIAGDNRSFNLAKRGAGFGGALGVNYITPRIAANSGFCGLMNSHCFVLLFFIR